MNAIKEYTNSRHFKDIYFESGYADITAIIYTEKAIITLLCDLEQWYHIKNQIPIKLIEHFGYQHRSKFQNHIEFKLNHIKNNTSVDLTESDFLLIRSELRNLN